MFFNPRLNRERKGGRIVITAETEVNVPRIIAADYIKKTVNKELVTDIVPEGATACKKLTFKVGFTDEIKEKIEKHTNISGNSEEYAVLLGEETLVCAKEEKGLLYGLATLVHLADADELSARLIYDYPVCSVRGYRVYMPGRENIGIFKDMIDLIAYYKYNAIILEIGGAMEYKNHPEINEKWVEACNEAHRYSGRAQEIQKKTHPWEKNSIHCDNGDGSFLTQDECRDIAAYCRERGLEVIPECPTLSHSDYIVMAHPEIAERDNDIWPDTYCPNHPDTYKLVFDVLDEVIEVFKPARINIGHDEFYTMCICPRCKGSDPVDIYVNDIAKIKAYLDEKGIGTMMWGEKLIKAVNKTTGRRYGGWYDEKVYPDGTRFQVPTVYPCIDKMPKGITYLNWYWSFGKEHDNNFHSRGYDMVFGNFEVLKCESFKERLEWGCRGGFVSNWGSNEDEYMQRNCQYFNLTSAAYAFWTEGYDTDAADWLSDRVTLENYRRHYKGKKNLIKVTHTTPLNIPFKVFYDGVFIEDEIYMLGNYEVTYDDGTTATFPVKYGTNISTWGTLDDEGFVIPDARGLSAFKEVSGRTLPLDIDGKRFYECGYENPCPEKTVVGFRYIPLENKKDVKVIVHSVKF